MLHHIPDADVLLDALTASLAPGGYLALADLDTEDGTFHSEDAGPVHLGFDCKELIKKLYSRNVTEISAITANQIRKNERDYSIFMISARKPAK